MDSPSRYPRKQAHDLLATQQKSTKSPSTAMGMYTGVCEGASEPLEVHTCQHRKAGNNQLAVLQGEALCRTRTRECSEKHSCLFNSPSQVLSRASLYQGWHQRLLSSKLHCFVS